MLGVIDDAVGLSSHPSISQQLPLRPTLSRAESLHLARGDDATPESSETVQTAGEDIDEAEIDKILKDCPNFFVAVTATFHPAVPHAHKMGADFVKRLCKIPGRWKSSKSERVVGLLKESSAEHKIIVFFNYIGSIQITSQGLREEKKAGRLDFKWVEYCGQTCAGTRDALKAFKNDSTCRVMLATFNKAAREADIPPASYIILAERPWTTSKEEQAIRRARLRFMKEDLSTGLKITDVIMEKSMDLYIARKHKVNLEKKQIAEKETVPGLSATDVIKFATSVCGISQAEAVMLVSYLVGISSANADLLQIRKRIAEDVDPMRF